MDKYERELLEEIKREVEQEKEQRPSLMRKYMYSVISLVLLLLLLFYFLFGAVEHVIRGKIVSREVEDGILEINDYRVVFLGNTTVSLSEKYITNQIEKQVETIACLRGTSAQTTYTVSEIFVPEIISQSLTSVTFRPCPDDTIIMLHTQPFENCLASSTDLDTLQSHQERNPDTLMLIMCKEMRFALYT